MERRSKDGGGSIRHSGIGRVGVEVSVNIVKVGVVGVVVWVVGIKVGVKVGVEIGVVGVEVGVLVVVGVIGMQWM